MLILKYFPKEICTVMLILQLEKYWLCVCEREGEKEKEKKKRGRSAKNRQEKDSNYVVGWDIKTAGTRSQCVHVCCCREISCVEFLGA